MLPSPESRLYGPPRWTIVVRASDGPLLTKLRQEYGAAPWVTVHPDRRARPGGTPPSEERRFAGRPAASNGASHLRTHRLAHEFTGATVYERVNLEVATACWICAAPVWFEIPRFGEPPRRLQLHVAHEAVSPRGSRHLVDLEAFGAADRPLISSRIVAQPADAGRAPR